MLYIYIYIYIYNNALFVFDIRYCICVEYYHKTD